MSKNPIASSLRRLLYRNLSVPQIAGFVLSCLTGLAIIILGLQFYLDARPIWTQEDSFIKKDYLVVSKKITGANTLGQEQTAFTAAQIRNLEQQPWVRRVGAFTSADYRIYASVNTGRHSMSTYMFLESIPTPFIDVAGADWTYTPGQQDVPIIISKDYLSLYNFGFASTVGMPTVSEQAIKAIPLTLAIRPDNGKPGIDVRGHIVGFSNRLNTILVPEEFMAWSNREFGSGKPVPPSRLIVDVSSPGDIAIAPYMKEHGLEIAGDKNGSQAAFLVNVVAGLAMVVGAIITLLSFFILLLSVFLLLQKNRDKIHSLIMLGVELRQISAVYERIIATVILLSFLLSAGAMLLLRQSYLPALQGMGGAASGFGWSLLAGAGLALLLTMGGCLAVRRKVAGAFYN